MIYSRVLGFERSPADGILKQPDLQRVTVPTFAPGSLENGCLLEVVISSWVILRAAW